MTRTCEACGVEYDAESRRSRYCSSACRGRAHRARRVGAAVAVVAERAGSPGEVEAAVRRELELLGVAATPTSAQALTVARRIDAQVDSGSGIAALSRQLEALRASLRSRATVDAHDPLAVLRARRRARLEAVGRVD